MFPHSRAIDEGNIEEERRLAYVGITRAMRDLTLTYARRRSAFGGSSAARDPLALPGRDPARADRPGGSASRAGAARRPGASRPGRGAAAASAEARRDAGGASSGSATTSCTPRSATAS